MGKMKMASKQRQNELIFCFTLLLNTLYNPSHQNIIDTKKIWNILSHIFATNLSFTMFERRNDYKLIQLIEPTHKLQRTLIFKEI